MQQDTKARLPQLQLCSSYDGLSHCGVSLTRFSRVAKNMERVTMTIIHFFWIWEIWEIWEMEKRF